MNSLFAQLALADTHKDIARNIVSLLQSQDLFDDLADDPAEWFNAIAWPFKHWQVSRFSDGAYGVWYGAESVETTVYESAYHWYQGLLTDAGFERMAVVAERKVYSVACNAALLDFRKAVIRHPDLFHPSDYTVCQTVGVRIHREGHPGLLTQSVRRPSGENVAIFNPDVLSNPRQNCQLTYRLEGDQIVVEQQPGVGWFKLDVAGFS